jgi:hypothetical protein
MLTRGKLDGSFYYDTYGKLADEVGWRRRGYEQLTFSTKAPQGHIPCINRFLDDMVVYIDGINDGVLYLLSLL